MANHCYNYIQFKGQGVDKVKEAFKLYEQTNYFDDFVHLATEQPITEKKDPYQYGTRWFEFHLDLVDDELLIVQGDSAWSPPTGMVQAFCKHFGVSARIEFEECGNDFGGFEEFDENGELTDSLETSYREWMYLEDKHSAIQNLIEDIRDMRAELEDEDIEEMISHLSEEDKQYVKSEI